VLGEVDAMLGQVLNAIEEKGLTENTLVIFTSDNGADWKFEDLARFAQRSLRYTPVREEPNP